MVSLGRGPIPARIMLVGEAWGEEEARTGQPFVGPSGYALTKMLHEAGVIQGECFITNLVNARPRDNDIKEWIAETKAEITGKHQRLHDKYVLPIVLEGYQSLLQEIHACQPNVIVALGNYALWALTGKFGVTKWRGSLLRTADWLKPVIEGPLLPKIIPVYHPAAVLRQWNLRAATIADFRRVRKHAESREYNFPEPHYTIAPDLDTVVSRLTVALKDLDLGPQWIDLDLETKFGHIACCGLSFSRLEAICIPFMALGKPHGYWSEEEEAIVVWLLYRVLCHSNARVRLQNGLFDAQYTHRHWCFVPNVAQDTMISQHALFSDQPKALYYQASIYAENYVYWKDEGKEWTGERSLTDERAGWIYNCKDCTYTREVGEVELELVKKLGLENVHKTQQRLFYPVLAAMLRGVRVRHEVRTALTKEVEAHLAQREQILVEMVGHTLNTGSPKQMKEFFYEDLRQPVIKTRARKGVPSRVTCDDEALQKIAAREPLLRPIVNCIADIRTLKIFLSSFLHAKLDSDGRMRCSFNIGGSESGKSAPKTFRLSSSKNAFGGGANLQTIPSEKSKSLGKAMARGEIAILGDPLSLPNLREMFGPDPGFTFFDMDLDRADLQVVVWEADDAMLKAALKQGVDIHLLNAFVIDGKEPPAMEELVETHPKYPDWRAPMKHKREFAKVFCHATNYVGSARTIAGHLARTVHAIERAKRVWFGAHPGIKSWHERVQDQITRHHFVENRFGYRWYIFDRLDAVLPEAVAWIPQSTVSNLINLIWQSFYDNLPEVEVLLQVHDSLAGQFPTHLKHLPERMLELSRIPVPYDDPLIIPTGLGLSEVSWGQC